MTKARLLGNLISQGQPLLDGFVTQTYVDTKITQLVNGAPGTLDTLKEIADQLATDESAVAAITTTLAGKANTSSLATVATSGSYTDLTNKPNISGVTSYNDLTNKPTLFSGSYTDLTNKPTIPSITGLATETYVTTAIAGKANTSSLSTVATSGSYTDLTNKPTIFSGSYTDLTNKPALATVATSGSYTDLTNKPTVISLKGTSVTYPGDDLAADPAGAQTIIITGTGFESTPTVYIGGTIAPSVTFVSSTQITVTTPAKIAGTYDIYIVNPGGATAIMVMGISYSGVPAWTTTAGSLGTLESDWTVQLQATSNSAITYALTSGSTLPTGVTLSSSGLITGTNVTTEQTFNFSVTAIDAELQDTSRSFSVTISLGDAYFKYVSLLLTGNGTNAAQNNTFLDSSGIASTSASPNIVLDPTTATNGWFVRTGSAQSDYTISPREYVVRANGVTIYTSTSSFPTSVSYGGITYTPGTYVDSAYGWSGDYINRFGINANSAVFFNSITRYGNTTQGSFSPYGSNWSNYFGGSGNYFILPANSGFDYGTGDYTIEGWIYSSSITWSLYATGGGGSADQFSCDSGTLYWGYGISLFGSGITSFFTSADLNQWVHVAICKSSGTTRAFKNGVVIATSTVNSAIGSPTNQPFIAQRTDSSYPLNGYMSNLRIVKGTAVYTSAFTPPTTPLTAITNTVLLTCQSNRFRDASTNNFTFTVNGTPSVQRFNPFGASTAYSTSVIGGSGYFDASADYLTVPGGSHFNFASNDFTIETWVYLYDNTQRKYLFGPGTDTTSHYNGFGLEIWGSQLCMWASSGSNQWNLLECDTTSNRGNILIPARAWTHIAVTRSGGNTFRSYVNGVLDRTFTVSGAITNSGNPVYNIGRCAYQNGTFYFNGLMSNFRVVNGTALYTTTFTPPTTPLTAITNTTLLLNFTNAGIIDNAMLNDIETVSNAQISTSVVKYGTGSIKIDNGSYLGFRQNPALYALPGDFTIEFWLYKNSASQYAPIIETRSSDDTISGVYLMDYNSTLVLYPHYTVAPSIETGVWIHFAVVRTNDTLAIYKNGTQAGTVACARSTYTYSAGNLWINAFQGNGASGRYLDGYIDDLRITKGYARYTANFTPPTTAFKLK